MHAGQTACSVSQLPPPGPGCSSCCCRRCLWQPSAGGAHGMRWGSARPGGGASAVNRTYTTIVGISISIFSVPALDGSISNSHTQTHACYFVSAQTHTCTRAARTSWVRAPQRHSQKWGRAPQQWGATEPRLGCTAVGGRGIQVTTKPLAAGACSPHARSRRRTAPQPARMPNPKSDARQPAQLARQLAADMTAHALTPTFRHPTTSKPPAIKTLSIS